jgi:hypothetical protein
MDLKALRNVEVLSPIMNKNNNLFSPKCPWVTRILIINNKTDPTFKEYKNID